MSASLDDMPEYEHFQDALDLELKRYQHVHALPAPHIEHGFIQYACFTIFLNKPSELSPVILSHIIQELSDHDQRIICFLRFINTDVYSSLKGRFSDVLAAFKE